MSKGKVLAISVAAAGILSAALSMSGSASDETEPEISTGNSVRFQINQVIAEELTKIQNETDEIKEDVSHVSAEVASVKEDIAAIKEEQEELASKIVAKTTTKEVIFDPTPPAEISEDKIADTIKAVTNKSSDYCTTGSCGPRRSSGGQSYSSNSESRVFSGGVFERMRQRRAARRGR